MHHSKSRETSEYQELGVFQKYIEKQFLERKGTFLNNKTVGFLSNMIYIEYCFISFACHFVTVAMMIILLTFSLITVICIIIFEVKNDLHKCEHIVRSCVKKA